MNFSEQELRTILADAFEGGWNSHLEFKGEYVNKVMESLLELKKKSVEEVSGSYVFATAGALNSEVSLSSLGQSVQNTDASYYSHYTGECGIHLPTFVQDNNIQGIY